jgi:hypothetical protein
VPTASVIYGVKTEVSVTLYLSSLRVYTFIVDEGDPDGRNVETELFDRISCACHIPCKVNFSFQNPSFTPVYPLQRHVWLILIFLDTLFETLPVFTEPHDQCRLFAEE